MPLSVAINTDSYSKIYSGYRNIDAICEKYIVIIKLNYLQQNITIQTPVMERSNNNTKTQLFGQYNGYLGQHNRWIMT